MKHAGATVSAYLSTLDPKKRAALERLRRTIRATVPDAEECISYGIPAFRLRGKFLLGFGAAAKHCSFFPGAHPIVAHRAALAKYDTSKGTVRFQPEKPLPVPLIRKLVKARVAEHLGAAKRR